MNDMDIKETMEKALAALRSGGVILYPTDTVWGLGCDASDPEAGMVSTHATGSRREGTARLRKKSHTSPS